MRETLNEHITEDCINENTESRKRKESQERDMCGRFLLLRRARLKPSQMRRRYGIMGEG